MGNATLLMRAYGKADLIASAKRHAYIAGGPGIGKTYIANFIANLLGIDLIRIQGIASMNALVIQLAVAAYLSEMTEIQVWIDDCDSLFSDKDSLSVMKGVLDEDRNILSWNKNMTNTINIYENSTNESDKIKARALRLYQTAGGVGVEIPTDNMRFLITSNRFLTAPNPPPKTRIKMDEATIHDRVEYKGFDLDWHDNWGWMAHTALEADLFDIDLSHKHILLDWMYNNWTRLPSYSMRAIRELATDIINYPNDYPDHWEARLIRSL
jgi:hypothetical protein